MVGVCGGSVWWGGGGGVGWLEGVDCGVCKEGGSVDG